MGSMLYAHVSCSVMLRGKLTARILLRDDLQLLTVLLALCLDAPLGPP
jgi:hypothetical protein